MVVQTVSDMRWQLPAVLGCMVPVSDGAPIHFCITGGTRKTETWKCGFAIHIWTVSQILTLTWVVLWLSISLTFVSSLLSWGNLWAHVYRLVCYHFLAFWTVVYY